MSATRAWDVEDRWEWNRLTESVALPSVLQRWGWGEMKRSSGCKVKRFVLESHEETWAGQAWRPRGRPVWWCPEGPFRVRSREQSRLGWVPTEPPGLLIGAPLPASLGGYERGVHFEIGLFHPENVLFDPRVGRDVLLDAMQPRWRRRLRAAERAGIVGKEAELNAALAFHDRELRAFETRKGFKSAWRGSDLQRMATFLEVRAYGAFLAGRLLAVTVVAIDAPVALAVSAVVSFEGVERSAGYVAHWASIQGVAAAGCAAFNLGGADSARNRGVADFKRRSGGRWFQMPGVFAQARGVLSTTVVERIADYLPVFLSA